MVKSADHLPEEINILGQAFFPVVIGAQIIYEIDCLISMGKVYNTPFGWAYQVLSLFPAFWVALNYFLNKMNPDRKPSEKVLYLAYFYSAIPPVLAFLYVFILYGVMHGNKPSVHPLILHLVYYWGVLMYFPAVICSLLYIK